MKAHQVLNDYAPGDYVQLHPRERPFRDDPAWWWEIVFVSERGLTVRHVSDGGHVDAFREDVSIVRVSDGPRRA